MNKEKTNEEINSEQKIYACWLDTAYWLSSEAKYKLLKTAGDTKSIYNMADAHITAAVGAKAAERIMQHKERNTPARVWNYITKSGISYTYCQEPDFPKRLTDIPDAPFGIFYKGRLPDNDIPSVALIGARKCSEYGKYMAEVFAAGFAKNGVNIISGMALGIDGISQKAALKAGGKSYAVLGCGADVVYPKSNEQLYKNLIENGGVLSEYPPGMEPRPALFPPRNRIISALSDIIVVVEAREKSGTLITVDMALEQGKEVYAIPGRCTDILSTGCNRLLRQGALMAVSPKDIIAEMHWEMVTDTPGKTIELSPEAGELYTVLDVLSATQDEIITRLRMKKSSLTVPQICQGLVELELKGFAVSHNRQYRLIGEKIL